MQAISSSTWTIRTRIKLNLLENTNKYGVETVPCSVLVNWTIHSSLSCFLIGVGLHWWGAPHELKYKCFKSCTRQNYRPSHFQRLDWQSLKTGCPSCSSLSDCRFSSFWKSFSVTCVLNTKSTVVLGSHIRRIISVANRFWRNEGKVSTGISEYSFCWAIQRQRSLHNHTVVTSKALVRVKQ